MNIRPGDHQTLPPPATRTWPEYDEEQIHDVVEVLRSGKVNAWTGTKVKEFEIAYAQLLGRRHAIALSNGTAALEVALHAIGLKSGDEVIVTPRSFVASASSVPFCGGVPIFADVDPVSQALTAETIAQVITPRTRAVIVVHLAGWPADMQPIMELCDKYGIYVIEDCAQAHGATLHGRPIGSFGHIAGFSFCQDKIITTGGEGGLLAMDDDAIWHRAWSVKDHGKTHDVAHSKGPHVGFRWLIDTFGSNHRMTEIEAAIGLRQLQRLETWIRQRTANASTLIATFAALPGLRTPFPPAHIRHAWYRAYTFVRPEMLKRGWSRDRIMTEIVAAGVSCFTGSCPEIYKERAFIDSGFQPARRLPNAKILGETSLCFLVDPCQDEVAMQRTAAVVSQVMAEATLARSATRTRNQAEMANWISWDRTNGNEGHHPGVVGG